MTGMHHNMTVEFPRCNWPLPHRDKHLCACICTLIKGHDGRHACTILEPLNAQHLTDGSKQ